MAEERYCFVVEWFDDMAQMMRRYQLIYYSSDQTVEMYDLKNRRTFLKRCECPSLRVSDLYLGATVTVYARQLKLVEYGDDYTRNLLEKVKERTLAMIKPDGIQHAGAIIDQICAHGLKISQLKMFRLSLQDAEALYAEQREKHGFVDLVRFIASGPVIAMELIGPDCVSLWRALVGPTSPSLARQKAPNTLRANYGTDDTVNTVHASETFSAALKEIDFFFNSPRLRTSTACFDNSALCVILPHVVQAGRAGLVIDMALNGGFQLGALEMFNLNRADAQEFLEIYRGVVPEFQAMVDHITEGPIVAMEVLGRGSASDTVSALRELAGPRDPEIARALRPKSLRAQFGLDKVKNAVHVTDLPEDGLLEVEYFFNVLQKTL